MALSQLLSYETEENKKIVGPISGFLYSTLTTCSSPPTMSEEAWEWTAESDVLLFKAMKGIRPVGVDKHFQMLQILSKWYALLDAKRDALLNEATSNRIEVGSTAQQRHERLAGLDRLRARDLWQRMGTYYDLDGLDELVSRQPLQSDNKRGIEGPMQ